MKNALCLFAWTNRQSLNFKARFLIAGNKYYLKLKLPDNVQFRWPVEGRGWKTWEIGAVQTALHITGNSLLDPQEFFITDGKGRKSIACMPGRRDELMKPGKVYYLRRM